MEIDDRVVPGNVLDAFCSMLEEVPDSVFLALGKQQPSLFRGFRAKRENIPKVREFLGKRVHTDKHLDPMLRILCRESRVHAGLVAMISETVLRERVEVLAAAVGETMMVASLLVSEQDETRQIGWDYLESWDGIPASDSARRDAAVKTVKVLHPLAEVLSRLELDEPALEAGRQETAPAPDTPSAGALRAAEERIATLKRQLEGEKERNRQLAASAQQEAERLNSQLGEQRLTLTQTRTELNARLEEIHQLETEIEQRVDARVRQQLQTTVRPWFARVDQVQGLLPPASDDRVLENARRLLAMQAEVDQHSGNRKTLGVRLEACQALLAEVDDARREALTPVEGLSAARKQLAEEIARIKGALGLNPTNPGNERLAPALTAINQATSLDEVAETRRLLDMSVARGLYQDEDLPVFRQALRDKASVILDREMALGRRSPPSPLQAFMSQFCPMDDRRVVLAVDGHNVLFLTKDYFQDCLDSDGCPGSRARTSLVTQLASAFKQAIEVEIRVYFDGEDASLYSHSDQVTVLYSGGQGRNRADDAILKDIHYQQGQGEPLIRIVTRDMNLATQALGYNAERVDPDDLVALLHHYRGR